MRKWLHRKVFSATGNSDVNKYIDTENTFHSKPMNALIHLLCELEGTGFKALKFCYLIQY